MIKKWIIYVMLGLFLFINVPTPKVEAKTLNDLKNELATLKKKKTDNQNNKNQTKNQISSAKNNVTNKQGEIETNQQKVEDAIKESEKLEVDIEEGKEKLANLMKAYQKANGDNVYLEYIFKATSYEDLIYRYAVMEQIMNYQDEQIASWKDKIEYNTQLKKDLAKREIQLNQQIDSLSKDIESLGNKLDELDDMTQDINAEIDSVQKSITFYQSIGCKDKDDLDRCMQVYSDKNFRRPLTKGRITSEFGYRTHPVTGKKNKFHSGTDIGGNPEGTPVYSIANGTVSKLTIKSNCGGNMVYIQHMVNGKKYTSTYMHLLTINVKIGTKVDSNTVIGTVGGGKSTSSKYGKYDTCTTGAHLHLSLATGWYEKDYTSYSSWRSRLINSRKYIDLPSSWSGR